MAEDTPEIVEHAAEKKQKKKGKGKRKVAKKRKLRVSIESNEGTLSFETEDLSKLLGGASELLDGALDEIKKKVS